MKDESEEFSCHTHPIYLAYPLRQKQNLPLGHKKKKTDRAPASARFAFRFFFPSSFLFLLALFFKVTWAQWQCEGVFRQSKDFKLSRPTGIFLMSVLKATSCTDTKWVHSITTYSHSEGRGWKLLSKSCLKLFTACHKLSSETKWSTKYSCQYQVKTHKVQIVSLADFQISALTRKTCIRPLTIHSKWCAHVLPVQRTPGLPSILQLKSWGWLWTTFVNSAHPYPTFLSLLRPLAHMLT